LKAEFGTRNVSLLIPLGVAEQDLGTSNIEHRTPKRLLSLALSSVEEERE